MKMSKTLTTHNNYYPSIKLIADYVLAGLLLLLLAWLFLVIIFVYAITFQFPFIFSQSRIGKSNRPFTMYKFRTLLLDSSLNDRRFWLGNFLRLTNLDELPQLWNVLKGEMSLVGPRPLPLEYLPLFSDVQKKRHDVLPGITGWAQVSGKNDIAWKQKFELDLFYVYHLSFKLDIRILVKTIVLLFTFRKDTSLSEEKFIG
jgi:lipopolysaccharide/colanic/teichoic acid biosynthesis glycosyltransferase